MKKVAIVILAFLVFLSSCGMSQEDYNAELEFQYQTGYEEGYEDCFDDIYSSIAEYIEEIESNMWYYISENAETYTDDADAWGLIKDYLNGKYVPKEDLDAAINYLFYFYEAFYQYGGCFNCDEIFIEYYRQ